jgi:hypothetical protein
MAPLPTPKAPRTSIRTTGHPIARVKLANRDRGLIHGLSGRLSPRAFKKGSICQNRLMGIGGGDYGNVQQRKPLREETSLPSTR